MPANLENSAVATGLEKVSFHSNPKERQCQKGVHYHTDYHKIALISHTRKVILKILQARFQQYVNHEIPDVQAGFRKAEESEINCLYLLAHQKNKRVPEKHLLLCY